MTGVVFLRALKSRIQVWKVVGLLCLVLVLPANGRAQCAYGPVSDSTVLFSFVKQKIVELGGPENAVVSMSFKRNQALIDIATPNQHHSIKWVTHGKCEPPFVLVSTPSAQAPSWAGPLDETLMNGLPHRPTAFSRPSPKRRAATPKKRAEVAQWKRWLVYTAPAWLRSIWGWLFFAVALLLLGRRIGLSKGDETATPWFSPGMLLVGAVGLFLLSARWGLNIVYSDELAYLHPGADPNLIHSFDYYLQDSGLPSRVHRLLVMILEPWGGLDALLIVNMLFYGAFVAACYYGAALVLPVWLSLACTALVVLHPSILYRFAELRSYGCFLCLSALAQWQLIKMMTTGSRRAAFAFFVLLGLAALDNPMTWLLAVAVVLASLSMARFRTQTLTRQLGQGVLIVGLGLLPSILGANETPHGDGGFAPWFTYTGPVAAILCVGLWGVPERRRLIATALWAYALITAALLFTPTLHPQPMKLELWLYPMAVIASAATLLSLCRLERVPFAFGILLTVLVAWYHLDNPKNKDRSSKITASSHALMAHMQVSSDSPIDTCFLRRKDFVEFASSMGSRNLFHVKNSTTMDMPGFIKGSVDAPRYVKEHCGQEKAFRVVTRYSSKSEMKLCAQCRKEELVTTEWSSYLCR
ncbi:MAG TPA: hypothetical protein EYN66_23365 [Myxococcales bacterium]|nr:hypothetical protein [Myxococcales bacterium]